MDQDNPIIWPVGNHVGADCYKPGIAGGYITDGGDI